MNALLMNVFQVVIASLLIIALFALILVIILLLQRIRQLQSSLRYQPAYSAPEPKKEEVELCSEALESREPVLAVESTFGEEDPLHNQRWVTLVEECMDLFDELDRHFANFDPPRQELADHLLLRLQEILERSGVAIITGDTVFDGHRHRPEQAGIKVVPGTAITETLSPGFAIGPRVLRRARVRLTEVPL